MVLLLMQSLCAYKASAKLSSKVLKEKKDLLDWVSGKIKKIHFVSY